MPRVGGERDDGVGGAAQQSVVDELLVTASDGPQRRRQREREQEVLGRQQALPLRLQPPIGALCLALGARAVLTAVIAVLLGRAAVSAIELPSEHCGAAVLDVAQRA